MISYRLALVLLLLPGLAFGTTVWSATWDLESGNPAYTTDYSLFNFTPTATCPTPIDGRGCSMSEGKYAIVTNPVQVHNLFNSINTDPSLGMTTSSMMVVNGATTPGKTVWQADFSQLGLTAGLSYEFSFWLTGIYNRAATSDGHDLHPASLQVMMNNQLMLTAVPGLPPVQHKNPDGSQILGPGAWTQYQFIFTAGVLAPTVRLVDNNTWASGNDFALAGFNLVDPPLHTPEPASWAFASIGFAALLLLRRRRSS
jgi:MYXO-CTERM domain-containing protein